MKLFFLFNEEVEWSFRFKKAGYKSVFLQEPSIIHLFGYSTKQQVQKQTINHLLVERYRGMFYFFRKHYGLFKLLMLRFIVLEGFSFRLFGNYLSSLFLVGEDKRRKCNERVNMMKIIGLIFKNNFDWRFKE